MIDSLLFETETERQRDSETERQRDRERSGIMVGLGYELDKVGSFFLRNMQDSCQRTAAPLQDSLVWL